MGVLEQRVADLAADGVRRDWRWCDHRRAAAIRAIASHEPSATAPRSRSTRRPGGSSMARRIGCRRSIVDRYADWLVVQTLGQGMDRRLRMIVDLLVEIVSRAGSSRATIRRCAGSRGWTSRSRSCSATCRTPSRSPRVASGIAWTCATARRPGCSSISARTTRRPRGTPAAARSTRSRYHGGFALQMAPHCDSVLALDSSAPAVAAPRATPRPQRRHQPRRARGQRLRRAARARNRGRAVRHDRARPAGVRARTAPRVERAVAGYKEINLRALKLLEPGGHLVTCSCSYNVSEALFQAILEEAAADARTVVAGRKTDAVARSSGAGRRAGDALSEVFRPSKTGLMALILQASGRARAGYPLSFRPGGP